MKNRKYAAVAVALAAAIAVTTGGCRNEDIVQTEDKSLLKVAVLGFEYDEKTWQKAADAFCLAVPGVNIELTVEGDADDSLSIGMNAGRYPDVVISQSGAGGGLTESMIRENSLLELSDVLALPIPGEKHRVAEKLICGAADSAKSAPYDDGLCYILPVFIKPHGLVYNQALFAERGWKPPVTWDDMWSLSEQAEGMSLFACPDEEELGSFLCGVVCGTGGTEFFENVVKGDKNVWGSTAADKVYKTLSRLPGETDADTISAALRRDVDPFSALCEGRVLFAAAGADAAEKWSAAARDENALGFALLPVEAGREICCYTDSGCCFIPKQAENKAVAKEFTAFLYSDEAARIFSELGAAQPIEGIAELLPENARPFYTVYSGGARMVCGYPDRDDEEYFRDKIYEAMKTFTRKDS